MNSRMYSLQDQIISVRLSAESAIAFIQQRATQFCDDIAKEMKYRIAYLEDCSRETSHSLLELAFLQKEASTALQHKNICVRYVLLLIADFVFLNFCLTVCTLSFLFLLQIKMFVFGVYVTLLFLLSFCFCFSLFFSFSFTT